MPTNIRVVITGTASSGKTTTLTALQKKLKDDVRFGYIPEQAGIHIQTEFEHHREPFADKVGFQTHVRNMQLAAEKASKAMCTFTDRSMLDNIAISGIHNGADHEATQMLIESAKECQYHLVFFLAPRPLEQSEGRVEHSQDDVMKQHTELLRVYEQYSKTMCYEIIHLGEDGNPIEIEERCNIIIESVEAKLQMIHRDAESAAALSGSSSLMPAPQQAAASASTETTSTASRPLTP